MQHICAAAFSESPTITFEEARPLFFTSPLPRLFLPLADTGMVSLCVEANPISLARASLHLVLPITSESKVARKTTCNC